MVDQKNPNPFSPENLAVRQTGGEEFAVQKLLTVLPVRKPTSKEWVRVHPATNFNVITALLEDADGGQPYIVAPEIAAAYPAEVKFAGLRLAVNRQAVPFLWKYPPPDLDGRENYWNSSHRSAIKEAEENWVRMVSSRSLGAYEIHLATGITAEPSWPDLELERLLEIAFTGRLISDPNHILIRQMRGEA
jgi:hypothetical protein